jgi:hypothetical protein
VATAARFDVVVHLQVLLVGHRVGFDVAAARADLVEQLEQEALADVLLQRERQAVIDAAREVGAHPFDEGGALAHHVHPADADVLPATAREGAGAVDVVGVDLDAGDALRPWRSANCRKPPACVPMSSTLSPGRG